MQVAVEGSFALVSACRVHAYTLKTVANMLSWIGSLRVKRRSEGPTGKFCKFLAMEVLIMRANTREAALVLVLPRPEEGLPRSVFPEGASFGKAYFAESCNIHVLRS